MIPPAGFKIMVKFIQMIPEIVVEFPERKVLLFFHIMKESFFENANGIFD